MIDFGDEVRARLRADLLEAARLDRVARIRAALEAYRDAEAPEREPV